MKRFSVAVCVGMLLFVGAVLGQNWNFDHLLIDFELPQDDSYGVHGVAVAPDGNIWIALHGGITSEPVVSHGGDTLGFYRPIYILDPNGNHVSFSPLRVLELPGGILDTLWSESLHNGSGKGISVDRDGNILYTSWSTVYRINYQTGGGMNRFIPSEYGLDMTSMTEAVQDANGLIYVGYVLGTTRPVYILDDDFNLIGNAIDTLGYYNRTLAVTSDGKDLYTGSTWNGFGIVHYHSDLPGVIQYTPVDTIGNWYNITIGDSTYDVVYLWASCLDWGPDGLLWAGNLRPDWSGPKGGMYYAFDVGTGLIVDSVGISMGDPSAGGVYSPRGAAWSPDGNTMYLGDYDYNVVGVWTSLAYDQIILTIQTISAIQGDTIQVPIDVEFPPGETFSSAEIAIGGYFGLLDFIEVDISNSLLGTAGWTFQVNETDSLLITASAGADDISGEGVLFWLKFAVPETTSGFIPITLESAIFNTGEIPVLLNSGGVIIPDYGDVDFNGFVQAYDASLILKYLVDYIDLSTVQLFYANVSLDTTVSALDASLILQYVVGLIDSLPYDTTNGLLLASGNIGMENGQIQAGQPVEVPLHLTNGDNILSFEGLITFNPEHLTFNTLTWSELVDGFTIETNAEAGEIKFAGAGSLPDNQEGIFATLLFTVNEDFSNDQTTVTIQRLRWNEEPVMEDVATATLGLLGINDNLADIPTEFSLNQNYPNPFNPITTIKYGLPEESNVTLKIFNILGREVATLVNEHQGAGYHQISWDANVYSSGIYFYRIQSGNFLKIRKMILMK